MIKRIGFFLAIFVLIPLAASAKPTIAVLDFDIEKNSIVITGDFIAAGTVEDRTKMLSSELVTVLVNTRKFDVIERDRIESILTEQQFSNRGMVDMQHAVQMGKLIGTDYLVMGRIEAVRAVQKSESIPYTNYVKHSTTGNMIVNMRIVDTRTGVIVAAKKVNTRKTLDGKQEAEVFVEQLKEIAVRQMVAEIIDGVFPIKVVGVSGTNVFLNRGQGAANFVVGDKLDVFMIGEELIDPDTNESLGSSELKIAEIVVTSIQHKRSVAEIVSLGTDQTIPVESVCRKSESFVSQTAGGDPKPQIPQSPKPKPNW